VCPRPINRSTHGLSASVEQCLYNHVPVHVNHRHGKEVLVAEAFVYVILQQEKEKRQTPFYSKKKRKEKSNHTTQKSRRSTPAQSCNKKHSPPMARGSFPSNGQFAWEGGAALLSNVHRWARCKQKGRKRKRGNAQVPGKSIVSFVFFFVVVSCPKKWGKWVLKISFLERPAESSEYSLSLPCCRVHVFYCRD